MGPLHLAPNLKEPHKDIRSALGAHVVSRLLLPACKERQHPLTKQTIISTSLEDGKIRMSNAMGHILHQASKAMDILKQTERASRWSKWYLTESATKPIPFHN